MNVKSICYEETQQEDYIQESMHSVNKANFAILHWFDLHFKPRFTDPDHQLKELYCADDPAQYEKCLIRHVGQIVATLGLKEMTQGTLGFREQWKNEIPLHTLHIKDVLIAGSTIPVVLSIARGLIPNIMN